MKRYRQRKILVLILAVLVVAVAGFAILYQAKQSPIKLNGDAEMTISLNGVYDEPGATAKIDGKDYSKKIKIDSDLDTTKAGKYTVKYSVKGYTAKRTITVTGEMDPVLELTGANKITVKLGESFDEPGYKATDKKGNDITKDVKVSYDDLNKAGNRKLAYTVEDSKGNKTRVFRNVTVEPNTSYQTPGLPICMYHYVYDENDPPEDLNKRFGNYISAQALEAELNWLNSEDYYYPTWKEVREYIDGSLMGSLDNAGRIRILVTDPSARVLYDSDEYRATQNRYALLSEVTAALKGYDVAASEYRDGAFRSRAATPVMYRGVTIGAVYVYENDADQARLLTDIQSNLRTISIVICVVVLIMSIVFSKALTRRIGDLLRAIRIVREGEYSHRVSVRGGDELSRLADEFNELTGRLQTTEEGRRRFVSDASHELKTPLASIRLLTDSLLQADHMDGETAREFLNDIGDEADRLTRITEKLLTLTRLDTAPAVEDVPVDVGAVVERVEHMLSPLARAVEVSLELKLQPGCVVLATEDDLYQIAFNLMENAVKYNLPGGRVLVTLTADGGRVVLRVEDTGVGIPKADLPKIFDRFYRVDKARSRAAGGTGLGLSIVRDTVLQHGGAVTARRREPEGTCFEVSFAQWNGEEVGR